jgi:pimeloyl-ACP methyl ester carboxylesterase
MQFTSETSSNGVIERSFRLDEITGVIWSPARGVVGTPVLLAGHSGGMHKKAPGLTASALHSVTTYGFTVAAIDAPGHGDRQRNVEDQRWTEAIHDTRIAGEPIAPIVVDYSVSLAERALPEWQATLDALQALPEIGVDAKVGYGGVSLGAVIGLKLTAIDSRIVAANFSGIFPHEALFEAAGNITVPVEYWIPSDDGEFDRTAGIALFDAFASTEKVLHVRSGKHHPMPEYERDSSARFFRRHLSRNWPAPV